jgi:26S proteasome regulatory subunit N6
MVSQVDDFAWIISSKAGMKYPAKIMVSQVDVYAMKAVADAYSKRLLKYFETDLHNYKSQLEDVARSWTTSTWGWPRSWLDKCSLLLSV